MIEIKKIVTAEALDYLKQSKGLNETQANDELLVLNIELEGSVLLKGQGVSIRGAIFKKFMRGAEQWLGAFDEEKLVGIHWHAFAFTGNEEQSDINKMFLMVNYMQTMKILLENCIKNLLD